MARLGTRYMQPQMRDPYAAMLGEDEAETAPGVPPMAPPIEQPPQPMDYDRSQPGALDAAYAEIVPMRDPSRVRAIAEAPAPAQAPQGVDVYRAPVYGADIDLDALRQAQQGAERGRFVGGLFAGAMKDPRRGEALQRKVDSTADRQVQGLLTRRKLFRDRYMDEREGVEARDRAQRLSEAEARRAKRSQMLNAATAQKMQQSETKAQRLRDLQDPQSQLSQQARERARSLLPDMASQITDNMSAADVEEIFDKGFKSRLKREEIALQNQGRLNVARARRRGRGGGGGSMTRAERIAYLTEDLGMNEREAALVARDESAFERLLPGGAGLERLDGAEDGSLEYQDQLALRMFAQGIVKTGALRTYGRLQNAMASFEKAGVNVPKKILAQYGGDLGQALLDGVDPQFSAFKQDMQSLSNTLLKEMSGAAVTGQEYKRFLQELGSGAIRSPDRIKYWMENLNRSVGDDLITLASGMSDKAVASFLDRVGDGVRLPPLLKQRAERGRQKLAAAQGADAQSNNVSTEMVKVRPKGSNAEFKQVPLQEAQQYMRDPRFEVMR